MPSEGLVLGIESSCDDTAAAIVSRDGRVLGAMRAGQESIHTAFGGVFPELASRAHVRTIIEAIDTSIGEAGISPSDIAAIAVTRGPGLVGPLMVGLGTAVGLGMGWGIPVIGVNHLRGHLRSIHLDGGRLEYPAILLLVSGGHTILAFLPNSDEIVVLGTTIDDSVGEAFDKVARMLGLGFPGGPALDKLAAEGEAIYDFPRPLLNRGLDFSFSGLKSAVSRFIEKQQDLNKPNVAASFSEACFDIIATKIERAIDQFDVRSLAVVGGVSASKPLRLRLASVCAGTGVALALPPLKWSTDNAAMIALAGYDYLDAGVFPPAIATPRLAINCL